MGPEGSLIPEGSSLVMRSDIAPFEPLPDWKALRAIFTEQIYRENGELPSGLQWHYTLAGGLQNYSNKILRQVLSQMTKLE